jgi:RimJ/RimL family protein N-acetyltransferase
MAFTRNGLRFREVEEFDLEWLRQLRNDERNTAGWKDPRSVQSIHVQDAWYMSLNNLNQAFVVEDPVKIADAVETKEFWKGKPIGLLRFRLDYPMSIAAMTGTDVLPEQTGHGYGRRILRSGAEYVIQELGFHRVTAECLDSNIGAARIIQEAGFKSEGVLRNYIWRGNAWHNWHIFSLLREDLK